MLSSTTGQVCLRFDDGTVIGEMPATATTNAFVVWLGYPVVVISEGVRAADASTVSHMLREALCAPDIPVVVNMGPIESGKGARAISDNPTSCPKRELARAEAYVLVQCAWVEESPLEVELDGQEFEFRPEFRKITDGSYAPVID